MPFNFLPGLYLYVWKINLPQLHNSKGIKIPCSWQFLNIFKKYTLHVEKCLQNHKLYIKQRIFDKKPAISLISFSHTPNHKYFKRTKAKLMSWLSAQNMIFNVITWNFCSYISLFKPIFPHKTFHNDLRADNRVSNKKHPIVLHQNNNFLSKLG